MSEIVIETLIDAEIEKCFDLSRSIDLHMVSTKRTNEKAVSGRTSGLICLDETVTWEATHLFIRQKLTSKITAYDRPFHFRDEQIEGPFKFIIHDHYFEKIDDKVLMKDVFRFSSPYGFAGRLFDAIYLKNYLSRFLFERNEVIKDYAESERWIEM